MKADWPPWGCLGVQNKSDLIFLCKTAGKRTANSMYRHGDVNASFLHNQ